MNRMFALFGGTALAAGLAVAAFAHDGVDHGKGGQKPATAAAGEGAKPVTIRLFNRRACASSARRTRPGCRPGRVAGGAFEV